MRVKILSKKYENFHDRCGGRNTSVATEGGSDAHADQLDDSEDDPHLLINNFEMSSRVLKWQKEVKLEEATCKHEATVYIL